MGGTPVLRSRTIQLPSWLIKPSPAATETFPIPSRLPRYWRIDGNMEGDHVAGLESDAHRIDQPLPNDAHPGLVSRGDSGSRPCRPPSAAETAVDEPRQRRRRS